MLTNIIKNPYRILGVYVNASLKERMSNINRFQAFAKVGKSIESNVDFNAFFKDTAVRTSETISRAQQDLNLPVDQLKWAFFWFANTNGIEDIAMRNLAAGSTEKALAILEKANSWSALLDSHTICLANDYLKGAAFCVTKLLSKEYFKEFLAGLGIETIKCSREEIFTNYIDSLPKDITTRDLLGAFNGLDSYSIVSKHLTSKLRNQLADYVSIAERVDQNDPEENLNAGKALIESSSPILEQLCNILEVNEYKLIADKVAFQVLQNAIRYYNKTRDEDAPRNAISLFKFALNTAQGENAKNRCQENYDIVKKEYDELPPADAVEDISKIKIFLDGFGLDSKSIKKILQLILDCEPILGSLKDKGYLDHPSVVKISTRIIRTALNTLIGEVNKAIKKLDDAYSDSTYYEALKEYRDVLMSAWNVNLYLDKLPIHQNTLEWYKKSRRDLEKKLLEEHLHVPQACSFDIRTELEFFKHCSTKKDYQDYLKRYPHPYYASIAKQRIAKFEANEEEERKIKAELLSKISSARKLSELWEIKSRCSKINLTHLLDEKAWSLCKRRKHYKAYLLNMPFGLHSSEARERSINISDEIIYFLKENKGWTIFIGVILVIIFTIGFVWGLHGIQTMLYIVGGMSAFLAYLAITDKNNDGCSLFFVSAIVALVCLGSAFLMDNTVNDKTVNMDNTVNNEETVYQKFLNNPTEENFKAYLSNYRDGPHIQEIASIYIKHLQNLGPQALMDFCNEFPVLSSDMKVYDLVSNQCDSLYNIATKLNTKEGWENYQNSVPAEEYRDSQEKIDNFDNIEWNTEAKAWAKASRLGTLDGYYKYTSMYPKGAHYSAANKKIIDLEVDEVMAGEYDKLPSIDHTSSKYGTTSTIKIYNNTPYTLILSYSGPDSKRISISSESKKSVSLRNGSYRCVATASDGNVRNYAGTENLDGGSYEVEYYIESTSVPSYRYY